MILYRCRCGHSTASGSIPPYPCDGCEKCGSTLDTSPESHRTPQPHDFRVEMVRTDDGEKPLTRCNWCGVRQSELALWFFEVDGRSIPTNTRYLTGGQIRIMAGNPEVEIRADLRRPGKQIPVSNDETVDVSLPDWRSYLLRQKESGT